MKQALAPELLKERGLAPFEAVDEVWSCGHWAGVGRNLEYKEKRKKKIVSLCIDCYKEAKREQKT